MKTEDEKKNRDGRIKRKVIMSDRIKEAFGKKNS